MKSLKMMLFLVVCLGGWNAQAAGIVAEDYSVDRFTDLGGEKIRWEQGTLFVKQGFIPQTSLDTSFASFGLTQEVVNAINGKFVDTLALWTSFSNIPNYSLRNFTRSVETYSIDGVPNVLVSLSGAGGGNRQNTKSFNLRRRSPSNRNCWRHSTVFGCPQRTNNPQYQG